MALDPRLHAPLINAGIGIVALLIGGLAIGTAGDEEAAALRALPLVDARALAAQAAGSPVLIEGRIAAGQPMVEHGLALLQRQHAVGFTRPGTNEYRFAWKPLPGQPAGVTSAPLGIDSGGTVTVVNDDFAWRDPPRVVAQPTTVVAGSTRLMGFAAGDAITLHATVVDGAQARVRAIEVFGGSHAQYLRGAAASAAVPYVLGGGFALAGVGMLIAAAVGWRRAERASDAR